MCIRMALGSNMKSSIPRTALPYLSASSVAASWLILGPLSRKGLTRETSSTWSLSVHIQIQWWSGQLPEYACTKPSIHIHYLLRSDMHPLCSAPWGWPRYMVQGLSSQSQGRIKPTLSMVEHSNQVFCWCEWKQHLSLPNMSIAPSLSNISQLLPRSPNN